MVIALLLLKRVPAMVAGMLDGSRRCDRRRTE